MKQLTAFFILISAAIYHSTFRNFIINVSCVDPPQQLAVMESLVNVSKKSVCDKINEIFEMKSAEDYFDLFKAASYENINESSFKLNENEDGRAILMKRIQDIKNNSPNITASVAFERLKESLLNADENTSQIVSTSTLSFEEFKMFMRGFEFKNDHFEIGSSTEFIFTVEDFAQNLTIFLTDDLEEILSDAVNAGRGLFSLDAPEVNSMQQIYDSIKSTGEKAKVLEALANIELAKESAVNDIVDNATRKAKNSFLRIIHNNISEQPTSNLVKLSELLIRVKQYAIAIKSTRFSTTSHNATSVFVEFEVILHNYVSYVENPYLISPLGLAIADLVGEKNIFVRPFLKPDEPSSRDIFVALSQAYKTPNAIENLNQVLLAVSINPKESIFNLFKKSVSKKDFNEIFNSFFPVFKSVSLQVADIIQYDCNIKICHLSNVTDSAQQFEDYVDFLKRENELKTTRVDRKDIAILTFIEILNRNTTIYKEYLEDMAKAMKLQLTANDKHDKSAAVDEKSPKDVEQRSVNPPFPGLVSEFSALPQSKLIQRVDKNEGNATSVRYEPKKMKKKGTSSKIFIPISAAVLGLFSFIIVLLKLQDENKAREQRRGKI